MNAPCALGSIRQRVAQENAPPAMPIALDDPAFLARLQAEAHATAARIAAATRSMLHNSEILLLVVASRV